MTFYSQSLTQEKLKLNIAKKMRKLADVLNVSFNEFKELARQITERKNQYMVYGLAMEIYQYYAEIISQIQVLECQPFEPQKQNQISENEAMLYSNERTDNDTISILHECSKVEFNIYRTYKQLLKNNLIPADQRELLQHQLNGFLYSLEKLRMLN
jgi:hypothetical protein